MDPRAFPKILDVQIDTSSGLHYYSIDTLPMDHIATRKPSALKPVKKVTLAPLKEVIFYDFELPHDHFITNESSMDGGNGITLTTTMVLTGGSFGQVEYYGFGGGADAITIHALNGSTSLGFVTFTLPESNAGQPEPLSFVDTSSFTGLSGITGYRIDRNTPAPFADNWVADDLQFVPVPEPYLKIFDSLLASSKIEPSESSTLCMKHAEA